MKLFKEKGLVRCPDCIRTPGRSIPRSNGTKRACLRCNGGGWIKGKK